MSIRMPGAATVLLAAALAACGARPEPKAAGNGLFGGAAASTNIATGDAAPASREADDEAVEAQEVEAAAAIDATAQPAPGTAQRAAIMDALRPAIERELGGPIEFVVSRAAVRDGWALVVAEPQRPGGGTVTPPPAFDTAFRDGLTVNGILRFSGNGWTLVDHAIGPTDVWYCGVDGPPRALTGC